MPAVPVRKLFEKFANHAMPALCFYFQVHQPFRIGHFGHFDIGSEQSYFDEAKNREILEKVARKCYVPANTTLLNLIRRFDGKVRISYSITGVAIEQMQRYAPHALESFVELSKTGCVEFLAETYYHSLASIYDQQEFKEQVKLHSDLISSLFGQRPQIFRNTELVYSDQIGSLVSEMGFKAVLAEGADDILGWRSPNYVYKHPSSELKLLLKNYRLSDDIAFRFSNRSWEGWPLTADKFAAWLHQHVFDCNVVNLFMDYETFGEHQWEETGIFHFLEHLPTAILRNPDWQFKTPNEVITSYAPVSELSYHRLTSWADIGRDLSAWQGNRMQKRALETVFKLGEFIRSRSDFADNGILDTWRKFLTSDHFYYMCTKWFADGDVHAYFSPYESPYEAYINFMNALTDFVKFRIKDIHEDIDARMGIPTTY